MKKVVFVLAFAACMGFSVSASAWKQSMTCDIGWDCAEGESAYPLHWDNPCVEMHLNETGTSMIPFDTVQQIVKKATAEWNVPERSSFRMSFGGLTNETRVGFNPYIKENANIIVFRDDSWTESQTIMALTSVTHSPSNGLIYDADIEINTYRYQFGVVTSATPDVVDLQNTLTHELGHVVGLDHSLDTDDATMNAYSIGGTTYMRDLAEDDIQGLETIYPPSAEVSCRFEGKYFSAPPVAMNEGYPDDSCSTMGVRRTKKISLWGLLFCGLCLSLLRRDPRHRLFRAGE